MPISAEIKKPFPVKVLEIPKEDRAFLRIGVCVACGPIKDFLQHFA